MLETKGKEEALAVFRQKGFSSDDAERAFGAMSEFLKTSLEAKDSIYIRGVCKIQAVKLPPRTFKDNLNNQVIRFGERVVHRFRRMGQ